MLRLAKRSAGNERVLEAAHGIANAAEKDAGIQEYSQEYPTEEIFPYSCILGFLPYLNRGARGPPLTPVNKQLELHRASIMNARPSSLAVNLLPVAETRSS